MSHNKLGLRQLISSSVAIRAALLLGVFSGVVFAQKDMSSREPEGMNRPTQQADAGKWQVTINCLSGCSSAECLAACIAIPTSDEYRTADLEHANASFSSVESILGCLYDGLGNVGTCADVFLGDPPDPEGFWVCAGGALNRFVNCAGAEKAMDPLSFPGDVIVTVRTRAHTQLGLELMMLAAESSYQALLEPEELSPSGRKAAWIPLSLVSTEFKTAGAQEAEATFSDCANGLRDDRSTCSDIFPNDPEGQKVCNWGAKQKFSGCLKKLAE